MDGLSLRKQLVGDVPLGHELGTSIIRRWAQLDKELGNESPYISFKHMMELDFATLALAEEDIVHMVQIQKQFSSEELPYPI